MAESWKIASKESELSLTSYETSLSIANEEIKILENNYKRLEDENKRLKDALYYADTIVYGTPLSSSTTTRPHHHHHHSTTGHGIENKKKNSLKISNNKIPMNENKRYVYNK